MLKTFRPGFIIWLIMSIQMGGGGIGFLFAQPDPSDSLHWSSAIRQLSLEGRNLIRNGKPEQGEQLMRKAIRQGEKHLPAQDPELAKVYARLARIKSDQTDFYEASSLFEQAHHIKSAIPDSFSQYSVASSYLYYGYSLSRIGRLNEAEELLREGLRLLEVAQEADEAGNDRRYTPEQWQSIFQNAYSMFSTVLIEKKEYSSAIDYYRRSLEILRNLSLSSPDSLRLAAAHMDLGRAYFFRGDSSAARENYEACLEIQLRLPRNPKNLDALANVYLNLGAFYQKYSDYSQALKYLEKIEQLSQQSGINIQARLLDSYLNRANIYKQQEKYQEGKHWLNQAQELAGTLYPERHPTVVRIHMLIGLIHAEENAYQLASGNFDKALDLLYTEGSNRELSRVYNQPRFWEALGYKGNIALEAYQHTQEEASLTEAYESFSLAIQLLDSIRIGLESSGAKEVLVGSAKEYYENAIETCRQLYLLNQDIDYLHEALRFAENSKALLLREALNEVQAQEFAGLPPALLDSIEFLQKKLELNRRQILNAQSLTTAEAKPKLQHLEAEAIVLRQSYYTLIRNLEQEYPEYYQLKYDLTTVDPKVLQQKLAQEQTIMYAYFRGEKALYIFEISGQSMQLHRVAETQELDPVLNQFLANLSDNKRYSQGAKSPAFFQEYIDQAHTLYQRLLPNLDQYQAYHLLIIPDGKLGFLPFELLLEQRPPEDAPVVYYRLPYLIRSFPIRYEYAASFFLDHPSIPLNRKAYAGFAPHYPRQEENPIKECQTDYMPLVFNQLEVSAVANSIGGKAFLGEVATEKTFRTLSKKYRVLHLAMHAFTSGESIKGFAKPDSGYSGLAFTPPRCDVQPPADDDGFLHTYELYNLRLNTELVVLSACNTGRGKMVRGEGIYSLARAFKYAGCANIIMSLWQVDDEATEKIVTTFFAQLKEGASKDEALRQAKIAYLDSAPADHPFFWAALVLIGDSKPVPMRNNWSWLLWGLLGLAAITTAAFLWNRRRQRG